MSPALIIFHSSSGKHFRQPARLQSTTVFGLRYPTKSISLGNLAAAWPELLSTASPTTTANRCGCPVRIQSCTSCSYLCWNPDWIIAWIDSFCQKMCCSSWKTNCIWYGKIASLFAYVCCSQNLSFSTYSQSFLDCHYKNLFVLQLRTAITNFS